MEPVAEQTLLTIIIPVYNVEEYLDFCLKSIGSKEQTADVEIILVDDASPDRSGRLCDEWAARDARIRVVHCTENGGLSKARNVGIGLATGKYITFVDSDDYLAPDTLEVLTGLLREHPDTDVMEYPVHVHHGHKEAYMFVPGHGELTDYSGWIARKGYYHCYAWNKVFSATLWKGICFPEGKLFEDIYTIPYVLQKARRILLTDKGLYYYCVRTKSITQDLTQRSTHDLLHANLAFYNTHLHHPAFTTTALDEFYLSMCNHQIMYLQYGGHIMLPGRKINLCRTLADRQSRSQWHKALLYTLFGQRSLIWYAKLRNRFNK